MRSILSLLILASLMLTTACKRTVIIPDEELALIFRDAYLTNAYLEHKHIKVDSMNLYAPIFEHYGYTTEDVQLTIGNFSKRKSARLGDVVERAIAMLEEEGLRYDHEVVVLDTIREVALRKATRVVLEDSLIRVSSLKDTTLLQITLPAEAGKYEVSYSYKVDSLDRNDRLQRKMWILRKNGSKNSMQIYTLQRNREDRTSRTFQADSLSDSLCLHLLVFPNKPKRPSITIRDLKVTFTPDERQATQALYEEQLGIRIFADEMYRQLLAKDSIQ
ncbi:MAG: DUF4296 domain-containing protein [Alistipes sp.]|nr:DUF4296 domain-containing protein [Alistipes sp.]